MKKCIIFLAGFTLLLAGCPRIGGDGAKSYTVKFSAEPAEGGSLTAKIKGGAAFTSGKTVLAETVLEFTATPKDGYKVEKWEGVTANPKDNTKTALKVTKDANVKVFFVKNSTEPSVPPASEKYQVTYSHTPAEGGSLTAKIKDGVDFTSGSEVSANTVLEFSAAAASNYSIGSWSGEGLQVSSDKKTATLTVTKKVNVTVTFVRNSTPTPTPTPPPPPVGKYTVTYSHTPDDGGKLTAKIKDGAAFTSGKTVLAETVLEFTATPKDGFKVEKWEGLTAPAGTKTVTLTVTGDTDVKVTFTAAQKRTITFSAEPAEGGSITAKRKDNGELVTNGDQVYEGTEIVFTAEPKTEGNGYYILRWIGEGLKVSSDKTTAELTVKKDTEVKVEFQQYLIENPNWEAAGILETKDGTSQKFYLVISDGNTLTVFDSSLGLSNSKFGRMSYDPNTKTLSFLPNQGGSGSIKFTSISPLPLPADWTIELENVKIQNLELENQTATINVTFNKDNFIR